MSNFNILIHHHALAYQDASQNIHMPSFIGRWINALSSQFGRIGLLLYESENLRPEQDEIVRADNVKLWSLGPPGRTWDRIPRISRLKRVCAQASKQADGLLIRGVTPRQMDVWHATAVRNKAFLLVGSLLQTKPKFNHSVWGIYEALMWRWRRVELMKISKQGVLMANSPLLVDELAELKRQAIFVPTNTIRGDEIIPFKVRPLSTPRRILFCGRVVAEKGIIEILHSVAQLSNHASYKLDIVGPVEPLFRRSCEELIYKLGISEIVKWHGRIPYGNILFNFYRQADVFVLPTYYEGFPHVIWEAAANCCPIITTHVGGIPALWNDEEHGLLISPKDVSALVEALNKLFSNMELRYRLIKNAHTLVKEFTVETCANRLVNSLYENGWSQ